jgi:DNA-binding PadR family transcriptional regulator
MQTTIPRPGRAPNEIQLTILKELDKASSISGGNTAAVWEIAMSLQISPGDVEYGMWVLARRHYVQEEITNDRLKVYRISEKGTRYLEFLKEQERSQQE